jgi:rhamnosyltransferase
MRELGEQRDEISDMTELSKVGVVIPTHNAASYWGALRQALDSQGIAAHQILIVDSSSSDGTGVMAESAGYEVVRIERDEFDHGGTRRLASEYFPWADVLIFMTQDALPADAFSFRRLYEAFNNPDVGAAYGRQLPRPDARPIERHARLFNYPSASEIRTYASREQYGIKAGFISNSFAAYRCSALREVGGFPREAIVGEDSVVACRALIAGWEIAYVADAMVIHSHGFNLRKEFARYFDIGVHHAREQWILTHFGKADKEGERFLRSELSYLRAEDARLVPVALFRTFLKVMAYQMGRRERYIPLAIKTLVSGQKAFWKHKQLVPQAASESSQANLGAGANARVGESIQSGDFGTISLSNLSSRTESSPTSARTA